MTIIAGRSQPRRIAKPLDLIIRIKYIMRENRFTKQVRGKSTEDLKIMIEANLHVDEAIQAAKWELENRNISIENVQDSDLEPVGIETVQEESTIENKQEEKGKSESTIRFDLNKKVKKVNSKKNLSLVLIPIAILNFILKDEYGIWELLSLFGLIGFGLYLYFSMRKNLKYLSEVFLLIGDEGIKFYSKGGEYDLKYDDIKIIKLNLYNIEIELLKSTENKPIIYLDDYDKIEVKKEIRKRFERIISEKYN